MAIVNALMMGLMVPGMINMYEDMFPKSYPQTPAVVRIAAGGSQPTDDYNGVDVNPGGPVPWVTLYDVRGKQIGSTTPPPDPGAGPVDTGGLRKRAEYV
jgi:hypothetical protein